MIYTRFYDVNSIPFDRAQALRYLGISSGALPDAGTEALLQTCKEQVFSACDGRVVYAEFPVRTENGIVDLGFMQTTSTALFQTLSGCDRAVVFAATVGTKVDYLIRRYGKSDAAKACVCQAIGSERVEGVADTFNAEITARFQREGKFTRPRFSCGYGDFPLDRQPDFLSALDTARKIGITLGDGYIMSPSKSITAVIGISDTKCRPQTSKCSSCPKTDCNFRRKESV